MKPLRHSLHLTTLPFVLAVIQSGCARFEPQPLSPAQSAKHFNARALDDPGLKQFIEQNLRRPLEAWPLQSWDSPKLTLVAWRFHPSLEVGRAQWRVADARVLTAGGRSKFAGPGAHAYPFTAVLRSNPTRDLNGNQPSAPANESGHGWQPGDTRFNKPAK